MVSIAEIFSAAVGGLPDAEFLHVPAAAAAAYSTTAV